MKIDMKLKQFIEKIFGKFSVYNLNKKRKRNEKMFDNPSWKTKWIFWWVAPNWLRKHIEGISFDNLYNTDDYGEKRTCLIFSSSKNNYWVFFRKTNPVEDKGDWHWCLKFMKMDNDHCCGG